MYTLDYVLSDLPASKRLAVLLGVNMVAFDEPWTQSTHFLEKILNATLIILGVGVLGVAAWLFASLL